jgi:enoyl-CoA hydratase
MSAPALLYEKNGHVATVTMNRPEARNSINPEMLCRLGDAWQDVNDDEQIRVVILTGAGEDAFCAGADLDKLVRMMQGLRPPESEWDERLKADFNLIYKGLMRNYDVIKPIVAAVKGFCVAGGLEILNCCDIRVAADDAQFGLAEVKWSLFPMGGSTVRIPRQVPWPIAMELMLTGERISAQEAHRVCLINKVVPRDQVIKEAQRYAAIIADNGPIAVQAVKRSALAASGLPIEKALEKEMEIGIPVSMSEDAREGPKAFKEKRKPVFKGR